MNCLILDGPPRSIAEIEAASLAGCPVALAPDALSCVAASQCSGGSAGPHQKANPLEIPFPGKEAKCAIYLFLQLTVQFRMRSFVHNEPVEGGANLLRERHCEWVFGDYIGTAIEEKLHERRIPRPPPREIELHHDRLPPGDLAVAPGTPATSRAKRLEKPSNERSSSCRLLMQISNAGSIVAGSRSELAHLYLERCVVRCSQSTRFGHREVR